ncbi:Laminin G domain [Trinorchestia longiramus]|nr:Laminin G domain [Trinorchestia longiramus]
MAVVRTRISSSLILALRSASGTENLVLDLRRGRPCLSLSVQEHSSLYASVCLAASAADGRWHDIASYRYVNTLELIMDHGDGDMRAKAYSTPGSSLLSEMYASRSTFKHHRKRASSTINNHVSCQNNCSGTSSSNSNTTTNSKTSGLYIIANKNRRFSSNRSNTNKTASDGSTNGSRSLTVNDEQDNFVTIYMNDRNKLLSNDERSQSPGIVSSSFKNVDGSRSRFLKKRSSARVMTVQPPAGTNFSSYSRTALDPDTQYPMIYSNFKEGCVGDLRVSGRPISFSPSSSSTEDFLLVASHGISDGCAPPSACLNVSCSAPYTCVDQWKHYFCR